MNIAVTQAEREQAAVMHIQPRKFPVSRILYYLVCSLLSIIFLFPIAWTVLTTLKPADEAAASPPTFLPSHISWDNYTQIFGAGIVSFIANSTFVVIITVIAVIILSTLGGYGFSRFTFPGKNITFVLILTTLMIPFQSILVPLFLVLHAIGLTNTLTGLALVYITFQLPFALFMMRNSFENVPRELEEAGLIDGCTPLSLLTRVILPVVFPGVVTVALFAFFAAWNEFLAALIFMTDNSKYTLPVYLINVQSGQYGTVNYGALEAGLVITMLPSIIVFLLLQRYYISGLISGSVKG